MEEIDYSEEAKINLFESVEKEKINWVECIMCQTAPSYDEVKKKLEKLDISISKKDYEKACKKLGFNS